MKRVSLNKNIQDLANVADEIVQLQQSVNTRFVEDEGHIKRESVHPLQGKATRMTTGMYGNLNININQSLRFFVKHNVGSGNYATLFGGIYLGGGTNLSFVAVPGQPQRQLWNDLRGNKLTEIVMTISETTMKLYKNGVLGFEFELTEGEKKAIQAGWRQRTSESVGVETIHFNHFNYALSPEEVKELYNNGRPDKVVLGNKKKQQFDYPCEFPTAITANAGEVAEYNGYKGQNKFDLKITSVGTSERSPRFYFKTNVSIDYSEYVLEFDYAVKSGKCVLNSISGLMLNEELVGSGHKTIVFNNDNQTNLNIRFDGRNLFDLSITNARVYKRDCIAEYLPSSLTPTTWFDTSGNSNHLTATGTPELIYTPIFIEEITAETAPTTKPDFSGQKWIDKKNNRLFIGL